jgi:hypothetical protein
VRPRPRPAPAAGRRRRSHARRGTDEATTVAVIGSSRATLFFRLSSSSFTCIIVDMYDDMSGIDLLWEKE